MKIKPKNLLAFLLGLTLNLGVSGVAHAALQGRDLDGNLATAEAYYDTDFNITWLADANYSRTSGYDADGFMTWADANTWAANLSFTDGVNVYGDWRLPTAPQLDASCEGQSVGISFGFNCTGSEMGHLFYVEVGRNTGQGFLLPEALYTVNNIQANTYWTGSDFAPDTSFAWVFGFNNGNYGAGNSGVGYQGAISKDGGLYAMAVSNGDVGIAAVPEPSTWAMLLTGLALVGVATRRPRS